MAAYSRTTDDGSAAAPLAAVEVLRRDSAPPIRDTAELGPVTDSFYSRRLKRVIDVSGAATAIVILSPVMAVAWLALRVVLGPRVVITQERVGLHGTTFEMYKFRSMRWSRRRMSGPFRGPDRRRTHKSDEDPRHTRVGRLLRKLSVDELPQLFNVLNGDMSLVGPRPEMATVVDEHGLRHHPRHDVRPGLTGLWQVTARQDGALLHESVDIDLDYLSSVTLRTDLEILGLTAGVVLGGGGR